jgi:hypothetical protein
LLRCPPNGSPIDEVNPETDPIKTAALYHQATKLKKGIPMDCATGWQRWQPSFDPRLIDGANVTQDEHGRWIKCADTPAWKKWEDRAVAAQGKIWEDLEPQLARRDYELEIAERLLRKAQDETA